MNAHQHNDALQAVFKLHDALTEATEHNDIVEIEHIGVTWEVSPSAVYSESLTEWFHAVAKRSFINGRHPSVLNDAACFVVRLGMQWGDHPFHINLRFPVQNGAEGIQTRPCYSTLTAVSTAIAAHVFPHVEDMRELDAWNISVDLVSGFYDRTRK